MHPARLAATKKRNSRGLPTGTSEQHGHRTSFGVQTFSGPTTYAAIKWQECVLTISQTSRPELKLERVARGKSQVYFYVDAAIHPHNHDDVPLLQ